MRYECRPQRGNYNAHLVTLLLFLLSSTCFIASGYVPKFPVILQSAAVLLLIPAIQLIGKYLVPQYLYRVEPMEDGSVDFTVFSYRGGTKMQLVCRVALFEITAVSPLTKENRRAPSRMNRFNYCMDLSPARAILLSVTNADGDCQILLSFDETLEKILSGAVASPSSEQ